jgi:hypothetical protein
MNQEGRVRDNLKELLLVLRKGLIFLPEGTLSPQGRASSGLAKQVTMQQFSKQGSSLLSTLLCFFSDS